MAFNLKNIPKCDSRFYLRFVIFKIVFFIHGCIKNKKL